MERYGYIYVIKNKINAKAYVGQTRQTIEQRWQAHINAAFNGSEMVIHLALVKYGVSQFYIEELERVSLEKLDEQEIYWITYFDSFKSGYNSTIGGQGSGKISDEELKTILDLWNSGLMVSDISRSLGFARKTIRDSLLQMGFKAKEIMDRYKDICGFPRKSVVQISPNNGKIIQIFPTLTAASKATGAFNSNISHCLCGDITTSGGFIWKYIEDISEEEIEDGIWKGNLPTVYGVGQGHSPIFSRDRVLELYESGYSTADIAQSLGCHITTVQRALNGAGIILKRPKTSVVLLSLSGKFIREFDSVPEAANEMRGHVSSIREGINHGKTYLGYRWMRKHDYLFEKELALREKLDTLNCSMEQLCSFASELDIEIEDTREKLVEMVVQKLLLRLLIPR